MIPGDPLAQPLKATVLETKAREGRLLAQLRGAGAGGVRGRAARCHPGAGRDLDRGSSPGPFLTGAPLAQYHARVTAGVALLQGQFYVLDKFHAVLALACGRIPSRLSGSVISVGGALGACV